MNLDPGRGPKINVLFVIRLTGPKKLCQQDIGSHRHGGHQAATDHAAKVRGGMLERSAGPSVKMCTSGRRETVRDFCPGRPEVLHRGNVCWNQHGRQANEEKCFALAANVKMAAAR